MSKTFAIVENGVVVNIALSETSLEPNWIETDVAGIGWEYNNGQFVEPPSVAPTAEQIRAERDVLLVASDWTQVLDAPVDQTAWATYRQALRDIPQQPGFPTNVIWPDKPV